MLIKQDTHKSSSFLSTGSNVAVEREDSSSWTLSIVVGHGSEDYSGRQYKISKTMIRHIITRIQYMKHNRIGAEDYLHDELKKKMHHT